MVLIDAIFINNGGGKILLDYLITEIEKKGMEVCYLLDVRIKGDHAPIKLNSVTYIKGIINRHVFYKQHCSKFTIVLCFGNLPPTMRLKASVYTYFQQYLFIKTSADTSWDEKVITKIKTFVLRCFKNNTDKWLVQSHIIKSALQEKYLLPDASILVIPFYPKLLSDKATTRKPGSFVYVSSYLGHKNHKRLINSFTRFYDLYKRGELHLTIGLQYRKMCEILTDLQNKGYPVFNHGFLCRQSLVHLYRSCEFSIYPSLMESFGLGIIEALENGCNIIGADRPYMHAVCSPSLTFDPESEEQIFAAFKSAIFETIPNTKQKAFDHIEDVLQLLLKSNHKTGNISLKSFN